MEQQTANMNKAETAFWKRMRLVPVKRKSFQGGTSRYRGVRRTSVLHRKPWAAQLNIKKKIVFNQTFWTELEAALAYDEACVEHRVPEYKNFVVPVKTQSELVAASLPLCYKNGSIPPGWRKKTTREKLMTSVANAVERDNSTRPHKLSSLTCQTYTSSAIQAAVERHNQHAGGDPDIHDEFNSMDDEKVMEELEKLEETASKATAQSQRGKKVWRSLAALRADLPHVADAVESLMARDAGGAVPVRIQINIYGEDGIDSAIHSLHIDPIKEWERVLCWSIGNRATFSFGGKAWDVWDGALLGWDYKSQEVHGIIGADGFRASIAITY